MAAWQLFARRAVDASAPALVIASHRPSGFGGLAVNELRSIRFHEGTKRSSRTGCSKNVVGFAHRQTVETALGWLDAQARSLGLVNSYRCISLRAASLRLRL